MPDPVRSEQERILPAAAQPKLARRGPLSWPLALPLLRRRRLAAGLAIALLAAAGLGLWQQQRGGRNQRNLEAFTVLAQRGTLPGVVTASGELDAVRRVNVSPKRQGLLSELYVDEGNTVLQGQPIALMDSGDLRNRINEQQARVSSARAELDRSRSEFLSNQELFRQQVISATAFKQFSSGYEVSRMAVEAAIQRLAQLQEERQELVIRAPFTGVITARFADPGAYVTPTTSASTSAGASSSSVVELAAGLEAVAKVPESDVGRLRVGQRASVRVDSFPDRRFAARIRQIAPRAIKINNVTSFEVKLQLLDPHSELRIGMTADIDFQTGELPEATLVPTVAIVTEDGRPGVLLVGPKNQPSFQAVELGSSSGRNTQILSGLENGTRIFIDLPPWAKKGK
ncbi:MAG: efflux RND transporter periplasmic adaptor subunit [Prochlorococcaceae cyanobacterium]